MGRASWFRPDQRWSFSGEFQAILSELLTPGGGLSPAKIFLLTWLDIAVARSRDPPARREGPAKKVPREKTRNSAMLAVLKNGCALFAEPWMGRDRALARINQATLNGEY